MKKALVLFSLVLSCSSVSLSEDGKTAITSVTGCLAGSAGTYTLTDQNGKSYILTGKIEVLAEHLGHQMEVTGQTASAHSTTETSTGAASLEVASTRMVSDQCATGTAKSTGDKGIAVGGWDKGTTSTPATDAKADSNSTTAETADQAPPTAEAATSQTTMNQADAAASTATSASPQTAAAAAPVPEVSNSPVESAPTGDKAGGAVTDSKPEAPLPQTASPLPLFGILALGLLCAGYMTLRTDE
jgi:hypothetical protein